MFIIQCRKAKQHKYLKYLITKEFDAKKYEITNFSPVHNVSKLWDNTLFNWIYVPPFNYYNFENTITQSKPETTPLGIANMLTCSPLRRCKTAVLCGVIETNNDKNECEIECMGRIQHTGILMNQLQIQKRVLYIMATNISQYITCGEYDNRLFHSLVVFYCFCFVLIFFNPCNYPIRVISYTYLHICALHAKFNFILC